MKALHAVRHGLLRLQAEFLATDEPVAGKNLSASDAFVASQRVPSYPKNTDVKHIRPSLSDRIDLALLEFPGRTALLFASLAALVAIVANVVAA